MGELKTKENDASVSEFIETIKNIREKEDAFSLLEMFTEVTQQKPRMWGSSIIGFGKYHYKSQRSNQEGDWPLIGFSPRKQAFSLYLMSGVTNHLQLLKKLGKHKLSSGSCLYIKRLADVDQAILKKLIKESFVMARKRYT